MEIKIKKKTESKRQVILDAASRTFSELGFHGASMSEICKRAGGSKATLYNYFDSKEELFFEIVQASIEEEFNVAHNALDPAAEDIAAALQAFGEKALRFAYAPDFQPYRRLAVEEAGRTALGRLCYERGLLRSQVLVTEFMGSAMARGLLRKDDPEIAAQQFSALLEAELLRPFLFNVLGTLSSERITAVTQRAVATFMAAYGRLPR